VPDALRMAVDELGEDHLLMATDYPHFDSEYAHTVAKTKANNLSFPSRLSQRQPAASHRSEFRNHILVLSGGATGYTVLSLRSLSKQKHGNVQRGK
jgi:hypothetical protein